VAAQQQQAQRFGRMALQQFVHQQDVAQ
jgi:hypothetical protein